MQLKERGEVWRRMLLLRRGGVELNKRHGGVRSTCKRFTTTQYQLSGVETSWLVVHTLYTGHMIMGCSVLCYGVLPPEMLVLHLQPKTVADRYLRPPA